MRPAASFAAAEAPNAKAMLPKNEDMANNSAGTANLQTFLMLKAARMPEGATTTQVVDVSCVTSTCCYHGPGAERAKGLTQHDNDDEEQTTPPSDRRELRCRFFFIATNMVMWAPMAPASIPDKAQSH